MSKVFTLAMLQRICITLSTLLVFSCSSSFKKDSTLVPNYTDSLKYAKGFTIEYFDSYIRLSVINPWETSQLYARYYLTKDSTIHIPSDGVRVQIPIKRIALGSATQFEFISLLDEMNSVIGVCDVKRIYNPYILKRISDGNTTDLGDPFQMNYERLITIKPEAVMMSGYNKVDEYSKRVQQVGLTVVYNNEWMENSLLARAEWIKLIALLYDKKELADSLFDDIESRYINFKNSLNQATNKVTILPGDNFRGTWYMPGGNSFMANLYKEAGADYFYEPDTTRGSIPIDYETALIKFGNAEVWIGATAKTLDELGKMNERNRLFSAFRNKQVYSIDNRTTESGGNDYWESAVARPDLLLADFIKALHPDLLPDHQLFYLKKLE